MRRHNLQLALVLLVVTAFVLPGCSRQPTTQSTTTQSTTTQSITTQGTTTQSTTTTTTSPPATKSATTATPSPQPAGQYGDLRYAIVTFVTGAQDPIKANPQDASSMLSQVYDLMFRMEAGKLSPGVIEKWEIAPDGLSWVYGVRKGIKFQDGSDLTAKDVKFSLERYMSKDATNRNMANMVDHIEMVDSYTLRIFTKSPQPFLPNYMTTTSRGQGLVMPMDYITKNGVDYFIKNPMGSGPWKFVSAVAGDSIQLTAKASHWRQTPAFKNLAIIVIPEPATRVAMLKAGNIDVTEVSMDDAVILEKAGYTIYPMSGIQLSLQFKGTYEPRAKGMPTADIRVRQALEIAVNQEEISRTLFYGKANPVMPSQLLYGQEGIDTDYWVKYTKEFYRYDPAKAKKLLADAGYPNGFSGLKLFVTPQPGIAYVDQLAVIVQSYWKAIGVNVDLVPLEMASFLQYRNEPIDAVVGQVMVTTKGVLSPPIINLEGIWGSGGQQHQLSRKTAQGTIDYMPELSNLVNSAMTEIDPVKRQAIVAQITKMGMDTHTTFAFGETPGMMAVGPNVKFNLKQPMADPYMQGWADMAQHR